MKKLCLLLPNISHAGIACRGNIPTIAHTHGYDVIVHDRNSNHFHENEELMLIHKQIADYEHILVISNSFGDLIARKLLTENHSNIKAHISVCWFGSKEYTTLSSRILLELAIHLWKYVYIHKKIVQKIAQFFNRPLSAHAPEGADAMNIKSGIEGLNRWLSARARYSLRYKESVDKITTPWYILFSENDNNFSPLKNAEYIARQYEKATLFTLGNAWHGSFLEMPEKYDPVIEDIFSRL